MQSRRRRARIETPATMGEMELQKRLVGAVALIAVMIVAVAVPLTTSGDSYVVLKGPQGPKASMVSWTYAPADYQQYYLMIDNFGLRWLVIDVYDSSVGAPTMISHQRISFSAYDAYPNGRVDSAPVLMAAGRTYEITAIPSGPRGNYAVLTEPEFGSPPNAVFAYTQVGMTVYADASGAFDIDGTIVQYDWDWGDGGTSQGVTASHTYASEGMYVVTLTAMDNDALKSSTNLTVYVHHPSIPVALFDATVSGLTVTVDGSGSYDVDGTITKYTWSWGDGTPDSVSTTSPFSQHTYSANGNYSITLTVTNSDLGTDSMTEIVSVWVSSDNPPVPTFTYSVQGYTVSVDASGSADDVGIVGYYWNWGDGSIGQGVTASHTYFQNLSIHTPSATALDEDTGGPGPPFPVIGIVYAPDGSLACQCLVKIKNMMTGEFWLAVTDDEYAHFEVDMQGLPSGFSDGDIVNVTAIQSGMVGYNESAGYWSQSWLWIDAHLSTDHPVPPLEAFVTLAVVDTVNHYVRMGKTIPLGEGDPPVASFTNAVSGPTLSADTTGSADEPGIVTYSWDWGDSCDGTGMTVSHTYFHYVELPPGPPCPTFAVWGHVNHIQHLRSGYGIR